MTTVAESAVQPQAVADIGVADLTQAEKSRSPWGDAWRRLRRNKIAIIGLIIILLNIIVALFAPYIAPYTYEEQNYLALNSAPQWIVDLFPKMQAIGDSEGYVTINEDYILGTDKLGRDLLTRIIYGARISLVIAFIGPFLA